MRVKFVASQDQLGHDAQAEWCKGFPPLLSCPAYLESRQPSLHLFSNRRFTKSILPVVEPNGPSTRTSWKARRTHFAVQDQTSLPLQQDCPKRCIPSSLPLITLSLTSGVSHRSTRRIPTWSWLPSMGWLVDMMICHCQDEVVPFPETARRSKSPSPIKPHPQSTGYF